MTERDRERLEQARFAALTAARISGLVLMLLGLWIWYGNVLRAGGWPAVGAPVFAIGALESILLPRMLARRWRSPPGP